MKTKGIFALVFFLAATAELFSGELYFITIRETMLYEPVYSTFDLSQHAIATIPRGTRVSTTSARPTLLKSETSDGTHIIRGAFLYNSDIYFIDSNDLVPANTGDTFAPSFISELNSDDRKTWVPSWYATVLQSMDRDTVLSEERFWREYDPWSMVDYWQEWYDRFSTMFPVNELDISNSAIVIDENIGLSIKNIARMENGYVVTVRFARAHPTYFMGDISSWDIVRGKEFFDMILIVDGDYMDVYLESTDHRFMTFVHVDQAFLGEMKSLVKTNHADLSNITFWPRRTDGSMDIPPPDGVSLTFRASHRTTNRLRVRGEPTTGAAIVATLEIGAEVDVVEGGIEETINGITAPWVWVQTADGREGWCFSGFLETVSASGDDAETQPVMLTTAAVKTTPLIFAVEAPPDASAEENAQNAPTTGAMPLWAWLAIGGGALAVAGGVFVARRKR
ncbi:MAG: SH3 domain-containing protein [Defluviitaleaceae bacterium]|nr:SH3 domain-containing protein [Defluviitaleaceae bacterium]